MLMLYTFGFPVLTGVQMKNGQLTSELKSALALLQEG